MQRHDVCTLIAESDGHGVHDSVETTETETYCIVTSVGMREAYTAMSQGLLPELRIIIPVAEDWNNQMLVRYKNVVYLVIRSYLNDEGGVELTLERRR